VDPNLLASIVTAVVAAAGAVFASVAQRRRIRAEAESVAGEAELIQDARTRAAFSDAAKAERRAARWADAFARAYRWIVNHITDHHPDQEPPRRTEFDSPHDDATPPPVPKQRKPPGYGGTYGK
jgi:hypothetical protein